VLCSFFGVAGTVIGTAATSLVATIGSAIYGYSLRRTKNRLRRLHQVGATSPPIREVVKTARENGHEIWEQLPRKAIAIGAVSVFVISIAAITFIELGLGKPLATAFGVQDDHSRTSMGFGSRHQNSSPTPAPSSTSSSTPSQRPSSSPTSSTPAPTQTVTVAPQTPTPTPTPSSSPTGIIPSLTSSRSH
jgi:cell division septation protein DedD